jgi:hypothetical protein
MSLVIQPSIITDIAVLGGSTLGATAAGLIPYWQKVRENQALGLPPIKFDKMFMGTIVIAFVIGIASAFVSYNSNIAQVDPNATVITVFIVSATSAAISNKAANSLLGVSSTVVSLNKQNKQLQDEINVTKIKQASTKAPVSNELNPVKVNYASTPVQVTESVDKDKNKLTD